jgi:hypothetical protein
MRAWILLPGLLVACAPGGVPAEEAKAPAPAANVLYANDFEKAEPGKVPDEFMVLEGRFAVKQVGENRLLELPGEPLDSMSVLFGPAAKDGLAVTARIRGTARGKLAPAFGVGLNGAKGWRLLVAPMRKAMDLLEGDEVKASVPYTWQSGTWTMFRLQSRKAGEKAWKIEGKAWAQGAEEPAGWMIAADKSEEPPAGKSSVCGMPFSDLPIQFDDLQVTAAAVK